MSTITNATCCGIDADRLIRDLKHSQKPSKGGNKMSRTEHEAMINALKKFIDKCHKLQKAGCNEREIAEALGFTQIPRFRQYKSMALRVLKQADKE